MNGNVLDLFIDVPNAENFKRIQQSAWLLERVFQRDKEIAKKFFGFEDWFKVAKDANDLDSEESRLLKFYFESSISCFCDAVKYFHFLGYDERILWVPKFIDHANSVADLKYILNHVDKKYRSTIVSKMREIAKTDEEKKIAFSYLI